MTVYVVFGRWAKPRIHRTTDGVIRICIGWLAIGIMRLDLEVKLAQQKGDFEQLGRLHQISLQRQALALERLVTYRSNHEAWCGRASYIGVAIQELSGDVRG